MSVIYTCSSVARSRQPNIKHVRNVPLNNNNVKARSFSGPPQHDQTPHPTLSQQAQVEAALNSTLDLQAVLGPEVILGFDVDDAEDIFQPLSFYAEEFAQVRLKGEKGSWVYYLCFGPRGALNHNKKGTLIL